MRIDNGHVMMEKVKKKKKTAELSLSVSSGKAVVQQPVNALCAKNYEEGSIPTRPGKLLTMTTQGCKSHINTKLRLKQLIEN